MVTSSTIVILALVICGVIILAAFSMGAWIGKLNSDVRAEINAVELRWEQRITKLIIEFKDMAADKNTLLNLTARVGPIELEAVGFRERINSLEKRVSNLELPCPGDIEA